MQNEQNKKIPKTIVLFRNEAHFHQDIMSKS